MDLKVVAYICGKALTIEGVLLLLPIICALCYGESLMPFILTMLICFAVGIPCSRKKWKSGQFLSKEGFAATGVSWIVLSLTGMLPFLFSGAIPNVVDAFFETVSGFTTTGASILTEVESLPKGVLLWRSFMHWIGGMGILVFMMAVVPLTGGSQMNIMKAESPGPSISKLVPKAGDTAKILYSIYTMLTVMTITALLLLKMPVFDALCISFGAAGTGGFGVLNDSCASYTAAQQVVITVAMIAFGINFNFFYLILIRRISLAFGMEEVRTYLLIIAAAILIITGNFMLAGTYQNLGDALLSSAFHVGSIITTTGYGTADINMFPNLSQGILVLLMFCGACAGSTGGGLKVSRVLLMLKAYLRELSSILHPGIVKRVHMDGRAVGENVISNTGAYFFIYMVITGVSILLVSLDNFDWATTFTSVVATFNNIGPGLGMVGTVGNYSEFSVLSKLVLSADMLIGRLEIFPILLLMTRDTWRKF